MITKYDFGSRLADGQYDSTARFYHERPARPGGGMMVTEMGTTLPALQEGWRWDYRNSSLFLKHDISCGVLDSVHISARTESGFRRQAGRAARKMLQRSAARQHQLGAAHFYERDYHPGMQLPTPPFTGFLNLLDILPPLPAGQHWSVRCAPYFELSLMEGYSTLGKVGPFDIRATLPHCLSRFDVQSAAQKVLRQAANKAARETRQKYVL